MLVLDTHALLWWVSGDTARLSAKASEAIQAAQKGGEIFISSMSTWELSMLVGKGRLSLSMEISEWLYQVSQIEAVRFMPVDNSIALGSVNLPGEFHPDPADRMIVATARKLGLPLVTADTKILNYPHVQTLW